MINLLLPDSPKDLPCERKMTMRTDRSVLFVEMFSNRGTFSDDAIVEEDWLIWRTIDALTGKATNKVGKFGLVRLVIRRM